MNKIKRENEKKQKKTENQIRNQPKTELKTID